MRQIGNRILRRLEFEPDPSFLRAAAIHQRAGEALAAVSTTGIRKGIYRFASHDEMNRHADDALAKAIVANIRQRVVDPGRA